MRASEWIKKAQRNGWRVDRVSGLSLRLCCSRQGCAGKLSLPLDNLGDIPAPCDLAHVGEYASSVFDGYKELVGELRRRRRQIGLDQQDLCDAMGVADGYINKLESFAKVASPPTLILWAECLGTSLTFAPAALPDATLRAIEGRQARPYQHAQARFKHDQ